MRSKGLIVFLIVAGVASLTWVLCAWIGTAVLGDKSQFLDWRKENTGLYLGIWIAAVVVLLIPTMSILGRRLFSAIDQQERQLLAAKGVGRLAGQALRGDTAAADKLVLLLKDRNQAVRVQSARALAILDDEDVNPTLFRTVRYWPGPDKLALITALRRTQDVRAGKLLLEFTHDRSPNVVRAARLALPLVTGRVRRGLTKEEDQYERTHRFRRRKAAEADSTESELLLAGSVTKPKAVGPGTATEPPVRKVRPAAAKPTSGSSRPGPAAARPAAARPGSSAPAERRLATFKPKAAAGTRPVAARSGTGKRPVAPGAVRRRSAGTPQSNERAAAAKSTETWAASTPEPAAAPPPAETDAQPPATP